MPIASCASGRHDSGAFLALGGRRTCRAGGVAPVYLVVSGFDDLRLVTGAATVGSRFVLAPGAAIEDGAQGGQAAHYDAEAEFDAGGLLAC